MAEKKLTIRLKLKYDTLENWNKVDAADKGGNLILLAGEVGICSIPVTDPQGKVMQEIPPATLIKVGDGATAFKDLPWLSAKAADVYAWAKKDSITVEGSGTGNGISKIEWVKTSDGNGKFVITKANFQASLSSNQMDAVNSGITADKVKKYDGYDNRITTAQNTANGKQDPIKAGTHITIGEDGRTINAAWPTIPTVGDGKITITQNGTPVGSFTVNQSGPSTIEVKDTNTDTNTSYQLALNGHTLKLQSKEKGAASWTDVSGQSFTLPDNDTNTTYTFAEGSTNGTFSVTPSGGTATPVKIHGLAALAYKASLGKGDVGLGNVENKELDTSVTASSGNYITSGAVKTYVDGAISGVKQFKYEVVSKLPTASASTMGKIYLKAHSHNPSDGQPDSYDEFITLEEGTTTKTYKWERIGNTDINLSGYVPTSRKVNGKPLSADISLGAADVGVTEAAFPGLKKTGTVTSVSAGDGLAGGPITSNGSLKVNLNSYAKNAAAVGGRLYPVELDKNGKLAVNVPWTDTNTDTNTAHTHTAGIGLVKTGDGGTSGVVDYKAKLLEDTKNTAASIRSTGTDKLYAVEADKNGNLAVRVPWTDTNTQRTDAEIKRLIEGYPGVNKVGTVTSVGLNGSTYVSISGSPVTTSGTMTVSLSSKVATTDDQFIIDCGSSTTNIFNFN